jgi:hypothetical protein
MAPVSFGSWSKQDNMEKDRWDRMGNGEEQEGLRWRIRKEKEVFVDAIGQYGRNSQEDDSGQEHDGTWQRDEPGVTDRRDRSETGTLVTDNIDQIA